MNIGSKLGKTQKNILIEKEKIANVKLGKDLKKLIMNNTSSINISKNKVEIKSMKKINFSNKPVMKEKVFVNNNLIKNSREPKRKLDLKLEKNDFITKKKIQTLAISNTTLVLNTKSSNIDPKKKFLKENISNPNLGSALMKKFAKKKINIEEDENSNVTTDINRYSNKKTEFSNIIYNIDELSNKVSSSVLIKTQENLANITLRAPIYIKNNPKNVIKVVKASLLKNPNNKKETINNFRAKSECNLKYDLTKIEVNNKLLLNQPYTSSNKMVKNHNKRPLSELKKNENKNKKTNEGCNSTEGFLFRGRIEDYEIGIDIGKGAYAIVKQAVHKSTNKKFAIKIYEKYKLLDPIRNNSVKTEIDILMKINHTSIVKLYEVIDTPKQILLVMELINGVSLLTYLKSKPNRRLEENEAKFIFRQVVEGINHLHKKNIYHRDIKLENLIIDQKNLIKIIDFGFAVNCQKTKYLNFFCGTPSYMAPEIVQKKDYLGQSVDIWSIGILLYTILCGVFPFRAISEKELYSSITKGIYTFPNHLSDDSKKLIKNILVVNYLKRIEIEKVKSIFN